MDVGKLEEEINEVSMIKNLPKQSCILEPFSEHDFLYIIFWTYLWYSSALLSTRDPNKFFPT